MPQLALLLFCLFWWVDLGDLQALAKVVALGPLIEIGAGAGHWQCALTQAGGDVLAFENYSELPLPQRGAAVGMVAAGDEQEVLQHPGRTLLLCYPPAGPMALRCLTLYSGDRLVSAISTGVCYAFHWQLFSASFVCFE